MNRKAHLDDPLRALEGSIPWSSTMRQKREQVFGRPADQSGTRPASGAGRIQGGGRAAPGQMPTDPDYRCTARDGENDRCNANKSKGSPFCYGHLRGAIKRGEYVE